MRPSAEFLDTTAERHYAAVVTSGLIVDGGIYRHDFVADAVIKGIMDVMLSLEVPIISAVLTPHHFHEHDMHQQFFFDHFRVKGQEAARACAKTIANVKQAKVLGKFSPAGS